MLSIEEYKGMFEAAPDGCVIVGSGGIIRATNPKLEQMFGWTQEELVGHPVEILIPEHLRPQHVKHRTGFVVKPRDRPMGIGMELRGRRKDGSEFPVEISLSSWRHEGEDMRVICSIRDVTAVRRLQNFSEGALRATEAERQRIARELHDDTAQRLATLILRVRLLAQQTDDQLRAELFEQVREEIIDASEEVKRMSRGLRPPELEQLGLGPALQVHVRNLLEGGVFHVDLEFGDVDPYLSDSAKLAMYRIVQEALSNARRHSGAASATVRLHRDGDAVVAVVSDRGRGFAFQQTAIGDVGLGLIGMQERATMIRGRLEVESTLGEGTTIRITVPAHLETTNG